MIPARFALAMQADGWILRSEIVWAKGWSFSESPGSTMPESAKDRPTKSHEMVYLFTKQERYFWDHKAIQEQAKGNATERPRPTKASHHKNIQTPGRSTHSMHKARANGDGYEFESTRNIRTVWRINTENYSAAHFACFPPALVEPMIKAGSRVGDTVLDPFGGSQTTGKVAIKLGRKYIGIDLAESYLRDLAPERLTVQMEMV